MEIIVINDGSKDNSLAICQKYAKRDKRITLINKNENEGPSPARDAGLAIATGDYIGFVDSDDYIADNMYESLLAASVENEADIVECGYYLVSEDYNIIRRVSHDYEELIGNHTCSYNYIRHINSIPANWSKLYKKEIFDDIRFGDVKYGEDYLVNVKAFYKCRKKITLNESYYYYVYNKNGITKSPFKPIKLELIETINKAIDFYDDHLPSLSNDAVFLALSMMRGLYEIFMASTYSKEKEYKKIIIDEFKRQYSSIKGEIHRVAPHKRAYIGTYLFLLSPRLYYYVSKKRKAILLGNK